MLIGRQHRKSNYDNSWSLYGIKNNSILSYTHVLNRSSAKSLLEIIKFILKRYWYRPLF